MSAHHECYECTVGSLYHLSLKTSVSVANGTISSLAKFTCSTMRMGSVAVSVSSAVTARASAVYVPGGMALGRVLIMVVAPPTGGA